jgi:hypothetical protein
MLERILIVAFSFLVTICGMYSLLNGIALGNLASIILGVILVLLSSRMRWQVWKATH